MTLMLGTNDLKAQFDVTRRPGSPPISACSSTSASPTRCRTGTAASRCWSSAPPPILEQGAIADKFSGRAEKSLLLADLYRAEAEARQVAFLDAGTVIESSAIDGIHYEPEMHQRLGQAVAAAAGARLSRCPHGDRGSSH